MKRMIVVLVCVLLIAVLAVPAFASFEDSKIVLKPSVTGISPGDTFTVEAYLTNKEPITICTVVLDYDTSVLELTGGTSHVPGALLGIVQVANKAGSVVLQAPAVFEGKVFTFNFTVKDGATDGTYKIDARTAIGNGSGNEITVEGTSVRICTDHIWTNVEDDKYLKVAATCQEKATYVESCAYCGEAGTETFEGGAFGDHTYKLGSSIDTQNHKRVCTIGGCTAETVEAHKFLMGSTAGEKTHWDICACGEKKEVAHAFDVKNWASSSAFYYVCRCGQQDVWRYTVSNDKVTIAAYSGSDAHVEIPQTVDGLPVTAIDSYVFQNCTSMVSVTIPDSVTSIGRSTFYGCTSLTSITLPDSVNTLGDNVFSDCTSLASLTVGSGLRYFSWGAFINCTELADVYVTDPSAWCMMDLNYSDESNPTYYGGQLHFLDSEGKEITDIVLDNTVTTISDNVFQGCANLTSITIPDSVTSIGDYAFEYCTSLTGVYITDIGAWCGISFADSYANPLYYAEKLYLNGQLVTEVEIPDGVTSIGGYAFWGCTSLTSVTIGDSVTSIGERAFSFCTRLTSITIPDSVTSIGEWAFRNCANLRSITIPDSVTSIGDDAFYNCDSLTSVTIPDSVTSIGNYAFFSCDSLTSVTIGDSVTSIGNYAFHNCTRLTSVTIGDSVTSIGYYAFAYCTSLKDVYYSGTKNQWSQISIGSNNNYLTSATIHYNHTHDYTLFPVTTVEPTCTAAGYREYTCAYGETYRETTKPALGHNTEANGTVTAPTCNSQGYTTNICTRCGRTVNTDFVAALGHDYSGITTVVASKCTEEGYTLTQCIRCASTQKSSITEVLGHNMVLVPAVPPTCTEPGLTAGSACERCGLMGVAQKEVAETGHNVINSACTNCGLCFPGDIDNSAGVDADDAIALLLYISMPDQFPLAAPADFNGDGDVDAADVVDLLLHICLPDIFPLQIGKKEN